MVWFGFMSGSPVLRPSERLSYHCGMLQVISGRTELETDAFTASTPWSGSFELFGARRVGCSMDKQDLCQTGKRNRSDSISLYNSICCVAFVLLVGRVMRADG
jgi:hypothetical protein